MLKWILTLYHSFCVQVSETWHSCLGRLQEILNKFTTTIEELKWIVVKNAAALLMFLCFYSYCDAPFHTGLLIFSSVSVPFWIQYVRDRSKPSQRGICFINSKRNYCDSQNDLQSLSSDDVDADVTLANVLARKGLTNPMKIELKLEGKTDLINTSLLPLVDIYKCFSLILQLKDNNFYLVINQDWPLDTSSYKCLYYGYFEEQAYVCSISDSQLLVDRDILGFMTVRDRHFFKIKSKKEMNVFNTKVLVYKFINGYVFFLGLKIALKSFQDYRKRNVNFKFFEFFQEHFKIGYFEVIRAFVSIIDDPKEWEKFITDGKIEFPMFIELCTHFNRIYHKQITVFVDNKSKIESTKLSEYTVERAIFINLDGKLELRSTPTKCVKKAFLNTPCLKIC